MMTINVPLYGAENGPGAHMSDCGRYRYSLWRRWNAAPPLAFIMLNPSTADALEDDPTIRRCVGFAKGFGYGGIVVVNLFAWRATKPKELLEVFDPFGVLNMLVLEGIAKSPWQTVAAWGALDRRLEHQAHDTCQLFRDREAALRCLGKTKAGHPRHPLYLPTTAVIVPWP